MNDGRKEVDQSNLTSIVFLPKIQNLTNLANFRSISLCMVLYKNIEKAIANRFQGVIGLCIDQAQSAFTSERLIYDNVLLGIRRSSHSSSEANREKRTYSCQVSHEQGLRSS